MRNKLIIAITLIGLVFTNAKTLNTANNTQNKDTVILLAMHGGVPSDFPKDDLQQFMQLHTQAHSGDKAVYDKAHQLEHKLRNWPRSKDNDPFYWGSELLQNALQAKTSIPVILAFNEFCAPSIEDAMVKIVNDFQPNRILVVTPMLTQGGNHSEIDIPKALERGRKLINDDEVIIEYLWPIPVENIARFLSELIKPRI